MGRTKPSGAAWALVAALALSQGVLAQRKPIGFVLNLEGKWLADGKTVQLGQQLLAASVITLSPDTTIVSGRSITVILADSTRLPYSCLPADACRFTLPASLNAETTKLSRLADAFNLIFTRSDRYVAALSRARGSDVGNLVDGVMKIDSGRIDAAPLLHGVDAGEYVLRFRLVPRDDAPAVPVSTVRVDWRAKGRTVATLPPDVGPGLYRVGLFPTAADADQLGGDAWILLAASDGYESAHASFARAAAIADSWGTNVPAKERRLFLRATLDQLALGR